MTNMQIEVLSVGSSLEYTGNQDSELCAYSAQPRYILCDVTR